MVQKTWRNNGSATKHEMFDGVEVMGCLTARHFLVRPIFCGLSEFTFSAVRICLKRQLIHGEESNVFQNFSSIEFSRLLSYGLHHNLKDQWMDTLKSSAIESIAAEHDRRTEVHVDRSWNASVR